MAIEYGPNNKTGVCSECGERNYGKYAVCQACMRKPTTPKVPAKDDLRPVGSFTAQENVNMAHFKSVQAHNLERIKKGLQPKSFHTYESPKVPA